MAALAATGAFAQSSVTLFGIADVGYISKTHTAANGSTLSKTTGVSEGLNAGNRIGFRGTEDLGGGLRAGFHIEQGINITNAALFSTRAAAAGQQIDGVGLTGGVGNNMPSGAYSTGTNRQSFLSLSTAAAGEFRIGYQYTALYTVSTLSGYHFASEQPGGDLAHGTLSNASFGGTRANGITYISPRMNGFQLTVQKGAAAGREDVEISSPANGRTTDNNNRFSLLLNYAQGPLNASLAHTSMKIKTAVVSASSINTTTGALTGGTTNIFGAVSATTAAAATDYDNKLTQVAGSYQLGGLKVAATYAKGEIRDAVTASNNANTKAMQIGAEYAAGAFRPFISLGTAVVENSSGTKTFDADLRQFGLRYVLSKRTTAYVMSGETKDSVATTTTIAKRKFTGAGLAHSF